MKTKIAFLFAALVLLGASAPAFAQCGIRGVIVRGNSVCATPVVVHHTPTVVATEVITPVAIPVALPIIVPAFAYQYVPPVVQAGSPIYPGAPFPVAGAYPVQPGYPAQGPQVGYPGGGYTGIGTTGVPQYGQPTFGQPYGASYAQPQYNGPYQQPQQPQQGLPGAAPNNDKLRELAKLLLEEMRRQDAADASAANGGQDPGPPMAITPGGPVGGPPPVGGPEGFPAPTVGAAPPVVTGGRPNPSSPFAQPAINALAKNCMSCHTGPGSKGNTVIFSQLNLLNPEAPFKTMLREIQQGRMPPRQSNWALTQQEYQALSVWLDDR